MRPVGGHAVSPTKGFAERYAKGDTVSPVRSIFVKPVGGLAVSPIRGCSVSPSRGHAEKHSKGHTMSPTRALVNPARGLIVRLEVGPAASPARRHDLSL